MSIQSVDSFVGGSWLGRSVVVNPIHCSLSTDTGLLLFGQFDEKLEWTAQFASLISDSRIEPKHSALSMVRQRVFGIIAGYEDQNDHDTLKSDSIFKLLANRTPSDHDLASQPTLSRFENSVKPADLLRMEKWFLAKFVESIRVDQKLITLDIDTFADEAHGLQQLTLWHDYYKQNQYQVRLITCAENDMIVMPVLLYGSACAKLGAAEDLKRVIEAILTVHPNISIRVRADSGFGGQDVYSTLESFEKVEYTIGTKVNSKTKNLSEKLLQDTVLAQQASGNDELRYMSICDYTCKYWKGAKRALVIKCEVTAHSTSRRVVISNRSDVTSNPELVYRDYAQRGESENRNKEFTCGLLGDRLSDHRYMATLFRVMMHSVAHNLLVTLRREVSVPVPEFATSPATLAPNSSFKETKADRKKHNDRRRRDPLGEGHPCTWRMHVIKVASRIQVSARRVVLELSASWPHLEHFLQVVEAIARFRPRLT